MAIDVDPMDFSADPQGLLSRLISRSAAMVERFGRMVDRYEDDHGLVYTAKSGVQQIRPEFAALRAERDSLAKHLELWLKVSVVEAQLSREQEKARTIDLVTTALATAVTNVLLRRGLDLSLYDDFMEEFRRVVRAWTADHPESVRPRAIVG